MYVYVSLSHKQYLFAISDKFVKAFKDDNLQLIHLLSVAIKMSISNVKPYFIHHDHHPLYCYPF